LTKSWFAGLFSEEEVDLLLDPLLVVGGVGVGRLLVNQARQVSQLINEEEELGDVVSDGGDVRVVPFQVLLVDLAHALETLIDGLKVCVGPGVLLDPRLNQQDRMRHSSL